MDRFIRTLAEALVERRWLFLGGVLAITFALAFFLKNLGIENSLEVWFLKNDKTLVAYNEFKRIYGNDEVILVYINPVKNVSRPEFIRQIYQATTTLEKHPMVKRALSITHAPYLGSEGDRLIVENMVKSEPDQAFDLKGFNERINSNPLFRKILFSKDGTSTAIIVEPIVTSEMDARRPELISYVKESCSGLDYRLAGTGVVYNELNGLTLKDTSLLTTLTYVILLASIFVFYRKKAIMVAATGTIVIITVVVLGVLGLFHQKLNMVSAIMPTLVLIMCLEDVIYIFSHYYDTPPRERDIVKTLSHVMVPCFFTSFTTAVGFFSVCTSPMKILKYFGIFAGLSVVLEYLVSIVIATFVLAQSEKKGPSASEGAAPMPDFYERFFQPWLRKLNGLVQTRDKAIVAFFMVVMAVGIYGITKINVDTYTIGMLLKSNSVRQDSDRIEKDYGYYMPLEVRLIPKSGSIKDPAFMKDLEKLQGAIDTDPAYNKSSSIADVTKQLNLVLTDGSDSSYRIPDTRETIAQELLLYEMDEKNDLWYFVDKQYTEARLALRVPMASSTDFKAAMARTENTINETFKGSATAVFGGYAPLYVKLIEYIAETQITSFVLAFVMIFVCAAFLLRSSYYLLVIVLPNIIPIIFTLGFMGFMKINLDVATVTVASIAIGLTTDNTIHYLYYFKSRLALGSSTREAVGETLLFKGAPMFISNIILVFGFMIMVFAHVTSVIYFGLLTCLTLAVAILCDLILLPALLIAFDRSKGLSREAEAMPDQVSFGR